ncbi:MAG: hypothetical protein GY865_19155, partial [candidate division Zixibacteria bacterium]|nr:hypothetical protein [candidate division Zixibacteria bacterium]
IERIIELNSFDGLNNQKGMALSMPIDIINGDTDGEWDVYSVTFLWGQFFGIPSNIAVETDWTGDLSVNGVADIKVFHKIDFEDGQDYLVESDNPSMSKWVSITNGDFDGLSFIVMIKRGIEYFAPLYLSFDTGPFQLKIPIEKLRMFKGFYNADNSNGVAVFAHKIWSNQCPRGMMKGTWTKDDIAGQSGNIRGLWLENNQNAPAGYFMGQFWTDENGNRLMEGYVTGYITAQIIAYFKGQWYYDDYRECALCGSGHGVFKGRFEYDDRDGWDYFGGTFGWGTSVDALELPLEGTWKKRCPTISNTEGWD